jgi:tRNA pseudouridine(38-40) synthase
MKQEEEEVISAAMTRNFKLIVSYDGTRYFGWEHQQETDLTIQGRLETVLTRMVDRDPEDPVTVIGAGRTDAGVHARAMTCNVLLDTEMSEEEIARESAALTEGEDALDPAVAKYVSELMLSRKKALSRVGLSDREREIIALSKEGLTDKQIADRLFLSPRTVSNHKQHIYGKLDVKSNSEMLKKIQEMGL